MATRQRINFPNLRGEALAAALERPDTPVKAYVLFAHCFTCGKDNAAASRISRTLTEDGFAVLRFDFTGLGGSEGDFGNTNFSSNVEDLVAAADYLRDEFQAPQLLVGHSLGGTAVMIAAARIPESRAVVSVGAPASPAHVVRQFSDRVEEIQSQGSAVVALGEKEFQVSRQFLDDVRDNSLKQTLPGLKKSLLILHAPFDAVVPIDEATQIFAMAKHPKSFVSLDGADHLLSNIEDARYVARTVSAWASRYIHDMGVEDRVELGSGEVLVAEANQRFLRDVLSDDHRWLADEPKRAGGDNLGPDPYEHLLAALGTCTSMTIRMYASRKNLALDNVTVELSHRREHAEDCMDCDVKPAAIDVLHREVKLQGALDDAQRARLMQIADRCPVHRTLEGKIRIDTHEARDDPV